MPCEIVRSMLDLIRYFSQNAPSFVGFLLLIKLQRALVPVPKSFVVELSYNELSRDSSDNFSRKTSF